MLPLDHLCRQTFAAHVDDDDFLLCKIDLRNAFNQVSRDRFTDLTRMHFPELSHYAEWCYSTESLLTFGTRTVKSSEGVQQGDPLGPLLFSLVMRELASEIHAATPKLDLNLWYLDDGILAGASCDVRHAFDVLELNGPRWGLHLNAAKCELAAHPASSHRSSVFPDLPGSNKNTEGNFHMLGSPVGTTEFRRQFLLDNAIEHAEDSLEAITNLEDPQVALSLIRHCTGFCQMVYSLRTTPTSELQDLCRRLDDAVQDATSHFFGPFSDAARRQAQRGKRFGGLGLRSAEEHSASAYVASVAFAAEKDFWDPTDAKDFDEAVIDVNKRAGKNIVDNETGKILQSSAVSEHQPFQTNPIQEIDNKLVIPRQRDLSHAISSHAFEHALAHADPSTRARWSSETGEGASEWAFVLPSKKNGFAYAPTEFRMLIRWWLGETIYPGLRPCPMEKCKQPLGPGGEHALACKCGHGVTARHSALVSQFSAECSKAGLAPQREVSLGNIGPGGALTRPGDVFIRSFGRGQALVLDFAVTHVLIVHVLKFSRGAAIYLPAGPSGHIIFSNYDVVFSNCMEGGVYSFVIFLLGCYFVTFKVLCPPTEPPAIWPRVPVGGNPVNRVTLIVLFYAGLFLFHLCACEMNE